MRLDARWSWRVEQAEAAEGRRLLREAMPRDEALEQHRKRLELDAAAPEVYESPNMEVNLGRSSSPWRRFVA